LKTGVVLNLTSEGYVRRRDFIKVIAGSTAVWPLKARAQQDQRMRRIGVLIATVESDPEGQARASALRQGLETLGWTESRCIDSPVTLPPGCADGLSLPSHGFSVMRRQVLGRLSPAQRPRAKAACWSTFYLTW
jgi:hypothetical protein